MDEYDDPRYSMLGVGPTPSSASIPKFSFASGFPYCTTCVDSTSGSTRINTSAAGLASLSTVDRSDECIDYLMARTEMAHRIAVEETIRLRQTILANEMQRLEMMRHSIAPTHGQTPYDAHAIPSSMRMFHQPQIPANYAAASASQMQYPHEEQLPPVSCATFAASTTRDQSSALFAPSPLSATTPPKSSNQERNEAPTRSTESSTPKVRVDLKALWNKRYSELVEFYEANGHCNIPQRYSPNIELGRWVKDQRTFKVKGKLSQERIELLNKIRFSWRIKCHTDFWKSMYKELVAHKNTHGHCNVSMSNPDNRQLACWVDRQRRSFKKGKISTERIKQLDDIGFVWSLKGNGPVL